jgi:hypothetical protein
MLESVNASYPTQVQNITENDNGNKTETKPTDSNNNKEH